MLAHRPAAINRYGNLFRSFDDRERSREERKVLPSYLSDGWARLPEPDSKGRAQYVNVRYLLPFGDLSDIAHLGQEGGRGAQQFVAQRMPGAQLVAAFATGVDPFTGQEIEKMTGGWKAWLMNFALPPLAGGYAYREIKAAAEGRPVNPLSRHGEPRSLKQAVLANVAGIRIRPVDIEEERRRRIEEIPYEIRDIHTEMRRHGRSKWLTDEEKQDALKEQMDRIKVLIERAQKLDPRADVETALETIRSQRP